MTTETIKTSTELFQMVQDAKSDMARTLLGHAMGAACEYENTRTQLSSAMEYCRRQIERAKRDLDTEGRVPNSLGVLQGNGIEVDRLCGELTRTRQAAIATQELLTSLGIH